MMSSNKLPLIIYFIRTLGNYYKYDKQKTVTTVQLS